MDFRNIVSDARMASMEKQVIHHLEKYDSIELELPAQITLISEA
jgi:hypothetical protein